MTNTDYTSSMLGKTVINKTHALSVSAEKNLWKEQNTFSLSLSTFLLIFPGR